jgi:hypothetical protein
MGSADEKTAGWIEAALAEYEAHRAEVLAESQGQQQTLALGATAVGILAAGGFNVWDERLLATIAFLGAAPLLSVLVLIQWAGRAYGMMRVGVYLERLETALRNAHPSAPAPILTWEKTIAAARPEQWWKPHAGWNDFGAVAVFALLAGGSIGLGAYRAWEGYETLTTIVAAIQVGILLLFTGTLAFNVATVRQRARDDFESP